MKAYRNLKKLEDVSRFAPWIFRIAHNEAYSLLRKRRPEVDADEGFPRSRLASGIPRRTVTGRCRRARSA